MGAGTAATAAGATAKGAAGTSPADATAATRRRMHWKIEKETKSRDKFDDDFYSIRQETLFSLTIDLIIFQLALFRFGCRGTSEDVVESSSLYTDPRLTGGGSLTKSGCAVSFCESFLLRPGISNAGLEASTRFHARSRSSPLHSSSPPVFFKPLARL